MPIFTYSAINADSAAVQGQIDALDLDAAKRALEDMHLEVVEIHEASRSAHPPTAAQSKQPALMTFAFEGTDPSGTVRRGTIQSDSKRHAFDRLRQDQKLSLTMLSPLGVTPEYRDHDLENWQRKDAPPKPPPSPDIPTVVPPVAAVRARPTPSAASMPYHPLHSTLRLYAGWLLAWYAFFVSLGYYATVRSLPFDIPFVQAFFVSPLIYTFIVAIFVFLFFGSLHRHFHGKYLLGALCTVCGCGVLYAVQMSMRSL